MELTSLKLPVLSARVVFILQVTKTETAALKVKCGMELFKPVLAQSSSKTAQELILASLLPLLPFAFLVEKITT